MEGTLAGDGATNPARVGAFPVLVGLSAALLAADTVEEGPTSDPGPLLVGAGAMDVCGTVFTGGPCVSDALITGCVFPSVGGGGPLELSAGTLEGGTPLFGEGPPLAGGGLPIFFTGRFCADSAAFFAGAVCFTVEGDGAFPWDDPTVFCGILPGGSAAFLGVV